MKKVFVVGGDVSVRLMFHKQGWGNLYEPDLADFICFTGGADVSPNLYGEENLGLSHCNPARDKAEVELFRQFYDKPKLGICRGGQLLNVLSGGKMIQDIPGHGMRTAEVRIAGNKTVKLHEDHHQGMLLAPGSEIIGVDADDGNLEIVYYSHTQSLCFQAHPEWGHKPTEDYFFQLIKEHFS